MNWSELDTVWTGLFIVFTCLSSGKAEQNSENPGQDSQLLD
jgi:hypothetical protein